MLIAAWYSVTVVQFVQYVCICACTEKEGASIRRPFMRRAVQIDSNKKARTPATKGHQ
jgi:hypothetical protein